MRDLKEMERQISNDDARVMFAEAVRSYQAGAYKASIISAWVAVVADLIGKIRHVADTGDPGAKKAVADLDKAIENQNVSNLQKFETNLLDLCCNTLRIMTGQEREELERISKDRNLCAHPAYVAPGVTYRPSSETTRAHLANAYDAAFSQRPIVGKQLLEVFKREIASDAWPESGVDAYLQEKYLSRGRESVIPNLSSIAIKSCLAPPDDNEEVARRCVDVCRALADRRGDRFWNRVRDILERRDDTGDLDEAQLWRMLGAFGAQEMFWQVVPTSVRTRTETLLTACLEKHHHIDHFIRHRAFASGVPADTAVGEAYKAAIEEFTEEDLVGVVEFEGPSSQWVDRCLTLVAEAKGFRTAEKRLRLLAQCSDGLDGEHIDRLCAAALENDQIRLAGGTEAILRSMYGDTRDREDLIEHWRDLADALRERGRQEDGEDDGSGWRSGYTYDNLCSDVGEKPDDA